MYLDIPILSLIHAAGNPFWKNKKVWKCVVKREKRVYDLIERQKEKGNER